MSTMRVVSVAEVRVHVSVRSTMTITRDGKVDNDNRCELRREVKKDKNNLPKIQHYS